jgi:hypothetical protein
VGSVANLRVLGNKKKHGEQTSGHQGGFHGKHIGRNGVVPLLKVEFLCISKHWTRGASSSLVALKFSMTL